MSYSLISRPIPYSDAIYTAIRCRDCKQVSHRLDDLEQKKCSFCGTIHKNSPKPKRQLKYRLYAGSSKSAKKLHWSTSGAVSLCNQALGREVNPDDPRAVCLNCRDLKRRNFSR